MTITETRRLEIDALVTEEVKVIVTSDEEAEYAIKQFKELMDYPDADANLMVYCQHLNPVPETKVSKILKNKAGLKGLPFEFSFLYNYINDLQNSCYKGNITLEGVFKDLDEITDQIKRLEEKWRKR